jgi:hypothetical protein
MHFCRAPIQNPCDHLHLTIPLVTAEHGIWPQKLTDGEHYFLYKDLRSITNVSGRLEEDHSLCLHVRRIMGSISRPTKLLSRVLQLCSSTRVLHYSCPLLTQEMLDAISQQQLLRILSFSLLDHMLPCRRHSNLIRLNDLLSGRLTSLYVYPHRCQVGFTLPLLSSITIPRLRLTDGNELLSQFNPFNQPSQLALVQICRNSTIQRLEILRKLLCTDSRVRDDIICYSHSRTST